MKSRSVKTLLSQGAAGGACGNFVWSLFLTILYSTEYGFIVAIFFPISLVVGVMMGAATGFVIWISAKLANRNLTVASRIVISSLFIILFSILLNIVLFGTPEDESQLPLAYRFALQIAFAIPIGMLAGSTVRPWRLIARGIAAKPRLQILFKQDPIRISRTTQERRFSFLPGFPLRFASLLGLMMSLLAAAWFLSFFFANRHANDWEGVAHLTDDFIECLLITLYFAATVFVSFTPLQTWRVLGAALVLHAPLAAWIVNKFGFEPLNDFRTFFTSVFMVLWLLFIGGKLVPTNRGPLQVEQGHIEVRFGKPQWVRESQ